MFHQVCLCAALSHVQNNHNYIIQCCSAQYCAISLLSIFTYSRTLIRESFRAVTKDAELHDCGSQEQEVIDNICCLCQIWSHGGSAVVCLYRHRGDFRFAFLRYLLLLREDLNFSEWTLK